jgi:hypothetical protein
MAKAWILLENEKREIMIEARKENWGSATKDVLFQFPIESKSRHRITVTIINEVEVEET